MSPSNCQCSHQGQGRQVKSNLAVTEAFKSRTLRPPESCALCGRVPSEVSDSCPGPVHSALENEDNAVGAQELPRQESPSRAVQQRPLPVPAWAQIKLSCRRCFTAPSWDAVPHRHRSAGYCMCAFASHRSSDNKKYNASPTGYI